MTTTLVNIEKTVQALHESCPDTKVFVSGAVVSAEYAQKIGADFYVKDAKESTVLAKKILG
jgi:5-methyltetrahydrofolate--homocysteine methyltransferase